MQEYNGIYVIENFLNTEEVDLLVSQFGPDLKSIHDVAPYTETALGFANSTEAKKLSYTHTIRPLTGNKEKDKAILMVTDIYKRLRTTMENCYQKDLSLVQFVFNRMHVKAQNKMHIDDATGMYPELEYSGMIYLNNCDDDFYGGEIVFPNQGLTLITKKGMLVFFKGDEEHPHGVNPITQGYRDNIITFFQSHK